MNEQNEVPTASVKARLRNRSTGTSGAARPRWRRTSSHPSTTAMASPAAPAARQPGWPIPSTLRINMPNTSADNSALG
ncbi:hypothetical protein D3C72_1883610 [compost metagenome]